MDNMFFSITENGNRNEIPISDDGVKIIENWKMNYATLFKINSCLFQLAINYKDFIHFIDNYEKDNIICKIPYTNKYDYVGMQYNRYLLNLASSYAACIDHFKEICINEEYNLGNKFSNIQKKKYHKSLEYRLLKKAIRNFAIHHAPPSTKVKITRKKIVCTKEYLLENKFLNSKCRNDIESLPNEIDLNIYISKAIKELLDMLNKLTYIIFNKGLEFYKPLEQYFLTLGIYITKDDIYLDINNCIEKCIFEKEYNFFNKIAENKKYATMKFESFIENT